MISKVILKRFKGFKEVTFDLPRHVVLVGPNNSGKTTLLQAIAAWELALRRWREIHDPRKHKGHYSKAPIARQAFLAVPLRSFDLLWNERAYKQPIEIEVHGVAGWSVAMEFLPDSTEQIHVRPTKENTVDNLVDRSVRTVFVPPMSGVVLEEALFANPETIDAMLARARAGDVLRNLLFQASKNEDSWRELTKSVEHLFGYQLVPPTAGAFIQADFRSHHDGPMYDITGAGSGFQQVLMLLCFLHTRPGSVLLLDEPDAHLHVVLQDAIYGELKAVAAAKGSQLVMATHSEVIMNAAYIDEIRIAFKPEQPLTDPQDKQNLSRVLSWITNVEVMQAQIAPGILYLEDYTDLEILRAWARILEHSALKLLTTDLFWRKTVVESPTGRTGISARDHYDALRTVRDIPGLRLVDGDTRPEIKGTEITGQGFQRLRWTRYEIESYLVHPSTLARFVETAAGVDAAKPHIEELQQWLKDNLPPAILKDPLGAHDYLVSTKARETILPPALSAGGLLAFPYTRYHEIAAAMLPEEIHPEVKEKLDALCKAFGVQVRTRL